MKRSDGHVDSHGLLEKCRPIAIALTAILAILLYIVTLGYSWRLFKRFWFDDNEPTNFEIVSPKNEGLAESLSEIHTIASMLNDKELSSMRLRHAAEYDEFNEQRSFDYAQINEALKHADHQAKILCKEINQFQAQKQIPSNKQVLTKKQFEQPNDDFSCDDDIQQELFVPKEISYTSSEWSIKRQLLVWSMNHAPKSGILHLDKRGTPDQRARNAMRFLLHYQVMLPDITRYCQKYHSDVMALAEDTLLTQHEKIMELRKSFNDFKAKCP